MRRVVDGMAVGLSQVKWAGYQGSQRLISSPPSRTGLPTRRIQMMAVNPVASWSSLLHAVHSSA